MPKPIATATVVAALVVLPFACSDTEPEAATRTKPSAGGKPVVCVVNYPLKYFAERIAGDLITVEFPAAGSGDPAFWRPSANLVRRFQAADLIVLNGASYAKWTMTASLRDAALVDTSRSFADRYIRATDGVTHSHGPGGKHSHAGIAFTTWLDPTQAIAQAKTLCAALTARLPAHKDRLQSNLASLTRDLDGIDQQLAAAAEAKPGHPLFASHPVYQYLQRRYSLALKSVHWEPDEPVSDEQWSELDTLRGEHPADVMLWEAEPLAETAAKLAAMGITNCVFAPCADVPETGDYLTVMRGNVDNLRRALRCP